MFKKLFRRKKKLQDTRRFKRFRLAYLIKYQINGKGEPRITNARDISAGGLRFLTREQIPESSLLKVSVYMPPLERSVEGTAQVLRMRKSRKGFTYYAAISFLDLPEEDRNAINEFAESLSHDQDGRLLIDHANIVIRKH